MGVRISIPCSGTHHDVEVSANGAIVIDTSKHDVELELSLGAIGGEISECVQLLDTAKALSHDFKRALALRAYTGRYLWACTSHMKEEDPEKLERAAIEGDARVASTDEGFFIWVDHDSPEEYGNAWWVDDEGLSDSIGVVLEFAKALGCRWVHFDASGPVLHGLPTYDW